MLIKRLIIALLIIPSLSLNTAFAYNKANKLINRIKSKENTIFHEIKSNNSSLPKIAYFSQNKVKIASFEIKGIPSSINLVFKFTGDLNWYDLKDIKASFIQNQETIKELHLENTSDLNLEIPDNIDKKKPYLIEITTNSYYSSYSRRQYGSIQISANQLACQKIPFETAWVDLIQTSDDEISANNKEIMIQNLNISSNLNQFESFSISHTISSQQNIQEYLYNAYYIIAETQEKIPAKIQYQSDGTIWTSFNSDSQIIKNLNQDPINFNLQFWIEININPEVNLNFESKTSWTSIIPTQNISQIDIKKEYSTTNPSVNI